MKNLSKLLLIVVVSFGIIGGCDGGDGSWVGPISFTSWPKKPKCADDERRCHKICFPKALDCPKDNTTDSDVYIGEISCETIFPNHLELNIMGAAFGPIGTEISFDADYPISDAEIDCFSRSWPEDEGNNFCKRTGTFSVPISNWSIKTIGHTDKFVLEQEVTVDVNGKRITTTIDCPDATGDIFREDCFTYNEIALSDCPSEKVLNVCERYRCTGQCGGFLGCGSAASDSVPFFPDGFSGCRVIDCNTIDCDQAKNIHIDGDLNWIELIDGEESEIVCF